MRRPHLLNRNTLRIIEEQSVELHSQLNHAQIWTILEIHDIPTKFLNLIQGLHRDDSCEAALNRPLGRPINVCAGIKQECILSLFHYSTIILNCVMKTTKHLKEFSGQCYCVLKMWILQITSSS